jgi:penicillin amidase
VALGPNQIRSYDLPPIERPGGAGTVGAIGATYRQIIDFADFDQSVATNVPGQSGQPESPFYGNLRELFAGAQYFPLSYTRAAVEANTAHRLLLKPSS